MGVRPFNFSCDFPILLVARDVSKTEVVCDLVQDQMDQLYYFEVWWDCFVWSNTPFRGTLFFGCACQDIFRAGIDGLSLALCDALVNHLIRPVLLHSILASAYPSSYVLPPLRSATSLGGRGGACISSSVFLCLCWPT